MVANAGSGTVTKIDTATNKVTVTIKVGNGPSGAIAISPDAKYAYVTNNGDEPVSVITLSYNAVKTITGVGIPTDLASPRAAAQGLCDQSRRDRRGHQHRHQYHQATLSIGDPTNSIALSADGTTLFVARTNDTLTAIDTPPTPSSTP